MTWELGKEGMLVDSISLCCFKVFPFLTLTIQLLLPGSWHFHQVSLSWGALGGADEAPLAFRGRCKAMFKQMLCAKRAN